MLLIAYPAVCACAASPPGYVQVHQVLYSSKWLSRVYAGEAMELLAEKVTHHSPRNLADAAGLALGEVESSCSDNSLDCVERFDVAVILERGEALLFSGSEVRHSAVFPPASVCPHVCIGQ
jgi:hypothetical protein